jgi:hypothetical protein
MEQYGAFSPLFHLIFPSFFFPQNGAEQYGAPLHLIFPSFFFFAFP